MFMSETLYELSLHVKQRRRLRRRVRWALAFVIVAGTIILLTRLFVIQFDRTHPGSGHTVDLNRVVEQQDLAREKAREAERGLK